jgi:tetratricopeptide (TPR) repeat protein
MSHASDFRDPHSTQRGGARRFGLRWLVLLFLLALVGPCAIVQGPREVGRWQLAAALRHRVAGDNDRAYARIESALRWLPDSTDLLLQRAAWRLEDGDPAAALEDANRAVELSRSDWRVRMYRSHVLQHAGRRAEAVEDWKWIDLRSNASGVPPRSQALNGLAYARAVAQKDLDEALVNVNRALELEPEQPAYLDTRGYIHYLRGQYAQALPDMNAAVGGMERMLLLAKRERRQPVVGPQFRDFTEERGVAVVRFHRALVLLALGRETEAEIDLARVRELIGGEPDDSLF